MLLSLNPYNQLPFVKDYKINNTVALNQTLNACLKALYRLDGFWESAPEDNAAFSALIHVSELRYSFDLEQPATSLNRLFEALASENRLNDSTAIAVERFLSRWPQVNAKGLAALEPLYAVPDAKPGSLVRDKKDVRVISHYTGLTLYMAPSNPQIIKSLRNELDARLKSGPERLDMIGMCVLHFQIRALSPFNLFNGHAARSFSKLFLRQSGFLFDVLPFGAVLHKQRESYNNLIRQCLLSEDLTDFCVFLTGCLETSAIRMLDALKYLHGYKKQLRERLHKYTGCNLPANSLTDILFSAPYIKPSVLTAALGCHRHTAYTYLKHLTAMGILSEKRSGREKLYLHKDLLDGIAL